MTKPMYRKMRMLWASIVDTIKLCSRQNLLLSRHCGSVKEQSKVGMSPISNSSNFVKMLHYCCRWGDTILKDHLESAAQNARYTSPEIQNELSDCCEELILEKIVAVYQTKLVLFYSCR